MAIPIRNAQEIQGMRYAGAAARDVLMELAEMVKPGITTAELDEAARSRIEKMGCISAFYQYRGARGPFPRYTCLSVNEEVVHGMGGPRVLQFGDIISIDVGVVKDGWIGDNAVTVPVGEIKPEVARLLKVTEDSLHVAIEYARHGVPLGDLSHSVENHVRKYGFTVVRNYVGHGVGRKLHEEPSVPNYGTKGARPILKEGMILAIEPMVNMGVSATEELQDGWTVVTADRKPSAHFEHTVLVTRKGPEILTPRPRIMGTFVL